MSLQTDHNGHAYTLVFEIGYTTTPIRLLSLRIVVCVVTVTWLFFPQQVHKMRIKKEKETKDNACGRPIHLAVDC